MAKNAKQFIGEIAVCTIALAILLTILIPTISVCMENGSQNRCRRRLQIITSALDAAVNDQENAGQWAELIDSKSSRRLLDTLKLTMDADDANEIDSSLYYIMVGNGELLVRCTEHSDIDDYSVTLPAGFSAEASIPETGEFIDRLHITGVRTYMLGEAINPDDPGQMQFSQSDDLKKLFPDLTVTAVYVGGGEKQLSPDEYTLFTDGFDMNVPGTKTIKVAYDTNKTWHRIVYADFTFEVLEQAQCPPLEIDFGDKGVYTLAAWDWTDFVAEASQSEGGAKDFDASIVYFEGSYYYYPDGFNIDSRRDNSNPETSAADTDDFSSPAYRIEFKTDVIIASKEDEEEMKKVENGALMLEEEQAYIWQTEPSKELGTGWIRVYCEMKKN